MDRNFDCIVVGAGAAGCTAAALYAKQGLRVALLERAKDTAHFKKVCTHFLQPVAMDAIRKLGLDKRIEAAGGVRNDLEVWTDWGWIRPADTSAIPAGYNIRRETLDPILRDLAIESPGVTYFGGTSISGLSRDSQGRISGALARGERGEMQLSAPLVVGADGRNSKVAELAGIPARERENNRFTYFTYYRDLPLRSSVNAQYWHLDENLAYAFRNDAGTTLLGIFLPRSELARFKADPLGNFHRFWQQVPDGPRLGDAEPICELRGVTKIPNHRRRASIPGLALVGDAAMVLDPIWGTGCSFAFASADWLVDATATALASGDPRTIDRSLGVYRKRHSLRTWGHYTHITSFSTARPLNVFERLLFAAGTRDGETARRILTYLGRTVGPGEVFSPRSLSRAMWVNAKHALKKKLPRLATPPGRIARQQPQLNEQACAKTRIINLPLPSGRGSG